MSLINDRYYGIIGQLHTKMTKAENPDDAIHIGMKTIMEEFDFDFAAVWYLIEEEKLIRPYYWLGPLDFTKKHHAINEGFVGKCVAKDEEILKEEYKKGDDPVSDSDFEGEEIVSMICVPLSGKAGITGCIQYVRFAGKSPFSEEETDICRIMADMFSLALHDTKKGSIKTFNKVLLSARDINKSFKSGDKMSHVLRGVNLDVYEGEFLIVLGESGCGKSTFLNIVGGMDRADSGSFTFMGKEMTTATRSELTMYRRKNIGFVFQSYNLMPNLTAKQNLDMIAELVDDPLDSLEVLKMVGLEEKKDRYPGRLSGGQQQRISIARALVKNPKIIFADEPTAALDYETSVEVLSVFEKIVKMGTTLVMVTHNEEITRMADRVLRFRNGRTYEITVNQHPVHAADLVW